MSSHDPLSNITGGDQALTTILRSVLEHVAASDNGQDFALMARDVLAGHLDLREVARMSVLENDLRQHINGFLEWKTQVGETEVARQMKLAERFELMTRTELDGSYPYDRHEAGQ